MTGTNLWNTETTKSIFASDFTSKVGMNMKSIISIKKAAKNWEEGLPIGNGRLRKLCLGKISEEMITINEETIWYGPFRNRKNPDCLKNIQKIRQLLLDGEVEKAQISGKDGDDINPKIYESVSAGR